MHKHVRGLFQISLAYLNVSLTAAIKLSHARHVFLRSKQIASKVHFPPHSISLRHFDTTVRGASIAPTFTSRLVRHAVTSAMSVRSALA